MVRCAERERPVSVASRKGEGIYDPKVFESGAEKSQVRTKPASVLKLTQVGEKKILRRSRERS